MDAVAGAARARERHPADAPARLRRLPRLAARVSIRTIPTGSGARRRRPRARVRAPVGPRRRRLARDRMDDLVRRGTAEHCPGLRPSLGGATPGRVACVFARRGRPAATTGRSPSCPIRSRGSPRRSRARRRRRRPGRDLHADGAGGRGRLARVRAPRRGPGADLLRLRRAGRRPAAPGLRRQGRDHGRHSLRRGPRVPMRETIEEARRESPARRARRPGAMGLSVSPSSRASSRGSRSNPSTPYLLTYTSGTTGRPKGALHVHGGFLVSIAREVGYQADIGPATASIFATDMGWIMGPWTVVGADALGATLVFTEGAPDPPDDRLWRLVEDESVTMLGVSPTLVRALIPNGDPDADLSSLRTITTTGEPWNAGAVPLADRAGRGLALPDRQQLRRHRGRRLLPLRHAGDADQGLSRSAARRSEWRWTSWTRRVSRSWAQARSASSSAASRFPGMTRGFWRDPERYIETYWSRFPGRLDTRRLGVGRRGRLLVPPRALRRHAQHRGEARRARGAGIRRGGTSGGGRRAAGVGCRTM